MLQPTLSVEPHNEHAKTVVPLSAPTLFCSPPESQIINSGIRYSFVTDTRDRAVEREGHLSQSHFSEPTYKPAAKLVGRTGTLTDGFVLSEHWTQGCKVAGYRNRKLRTGQKGQCECFTERESVWR
jgi:hypothetical protein